MTQISSTLLEAPPPPPKGRGAGAGSAIPPDAPPDAPFASVLEDQARTAVAEGHHRGDAPAGEPRREPAEADAAAAGGAPAGQPGTTTPAAPAPLDQEAADLLLLAALVAQTAEARGPATAAASVTAAPAQSAPVVTAPPSVLPGGTPATPDQEASGMGRVLTALGGEPATAGQAVPGQPAGQAAAPSTASAAPAPPSVPPGGTPATPGQEASGAQRASASLGAEPASAAVAGQPAGQQAAAAAAAQPNGQSASAPAAPQPAPAAAAPAAVAAAEAPAQARAITLAHAVETVRLALKASADTGVSHARIALSPRELGGIEIHLRHTPDGLVARVIAEHAAAAQLLHGAGAELRRSLEGQGLTLLQLDVGTSDQDAAAGGATSGGRRDLASGGGASAGQNGGSPEANGHRGRNGGAQSTALEGELLVPAAGDDPSRTLRLTNGALVDVLA